MKKKTITLIAAAVLAAAPIAGVTVSNIKPQIVKADSNGDDDTVMGAIVLKPTPKKQPLNFNSPADIKDKLIAKDIQLNHGRVDTAKGDYQSVFYVRTVAADGHYVWSNPKSADELKNGDQGTIVFSFPVAGLDDSHEYFYPCKLGPDGLGGDDSSDSVGGTIGGNVEVAIPFTIDNSKPSTLTSKPSKTTSRPSRKPARVKKSSHRKSSTKKRKSTARRRKARRARKNKRTRRSKKHVRRNKKRVRRSRRHVRRNKKRARRR